MAEEKNPSKTYRKPLEKEIEIENSFDREDAEGAIEHIEAFLGSWKENLSLEPIDLTSAEGAQAAIGHLEDKIEVLGKKLDTSRALRKLITK